MSFDVCITVVLNCHRAKACARRFKMTLWKHSPCSAATRLKQLAMPVYGGISPLRMRGLESCRCHIKIRLRAHAARVPSWPSAASGVIVLHITQGSGQQNSHFVSTAVPCGAILLLWHCPGACAEADSNAKRHCCSSSPTWVCSSSLTRSMGATTVLEMAPAVPPARKSFGQSSMIDEPKFND